MLTTQFFDKEWVEKNLSDYASGSYDCLAKISGEPETVFGLRKTISEPSIFASDDEEADMYVYINNYSDFLDVVIEVNNYLMEMKDYE